LFVGKLPDALVSPVGERHWPLKVFAAGAVPFGTATPGTGVVAAGVEGELLVGAALVGVVLVGATAFEGGGFVGAALAGVAAAVGCTPFEAPTGATPAVFGGNDEAGGGTVDWARTAGVSSEPITKTSGRTKRAMFLPPCRTRGREYRKGGK
jgi:hypothetical protein